MGERSDQRDRPAHPAQRRCLRGASLSTASGRAKAASSTLTAMSTRARSRTTASTGVGTFTGTDGYVLHRSNGSRGGGGGVNGEGGGAGSRGTGARSPNPDGSVYEGEFKDDLADGTGKITYPDGNTYEGEWEGRGDRGRGHGDLLPTDSSTEGGFRNAQMHGTGTDDLRRRLPLRGRMAGRPALGDGNRDLFRRQPSTKATSSPASARGQGTITMPDGFTYTGAWEDGEIDGEGVATYANGDCLRGDVQLREAPGRGNHPLCLGGGRQRKLGRRARSPRPTPYPKVKTPPPKRKTPHPGRKRRRSDPPPTGCAAARGQECQAPAFTTCPN